MELFVGLVASRAPLTVTIPEHRLVGYSNPSGARIPSPPEPPRSNKMCSTFCVWRTCGSTSVGSGVFIIK
jgi:hypothetical protein